jgi:uncharacterized protein (TIGR03084 family)
MPLVRSRDRFRRSTAVDEVVGALREQLDELASLVSGLDAEEWLAPSACPGWSVRDVLLHLAQTNDVAIASVEGRWDEVTAMWAGVEATDVDAAAGAAVAGSDLSPAEVHTWWTRSAAAMLRAFETCDPSARVGWVAGDLAARTLCTTRLSETWIHATDIAVGLDVDLAPTDRLWHVARLVHRTLPYAFARAGRDAPGPVRFELTSPTDPSAVWTFGDEDAPTVVAGPAHDLCRVAGQRAGVTGSALHASGPDAEAVLALMRTFA